MIRLSDFEIYNRDYLEVALRSNRLTYGDLSKMFEDRFSDAHDCEHGVFVNSGTSALQLSLQALKEIHGWPDGAEVIVPALTFVATVNIVLHCNLTPVLCDIDPNTLNLDPSALERILGPSTVCVIPVHIMGNPAPMDEIMMLTEMHGVKVIEDSCETVFTGVNGRSVGSWGDFGCFSTYAAHPLTTGVGGVITTKEPILEEYVRSLANHGRHSDYISIDDRSTDWKVQRKIVESRYNFPRIGHSYRATEMEAAIGLDQMDHKAINVRRRIEVLEWFNISFTYGPTPNFHDLTLPFNTDGPHHNIMPMMYPAITKPGKRPQVRDALEQSGVETRDMVQILHQPCYKGLWSPEDYPYANHISKNGMLWGCHQGMSRDDVDHIVDVASEASLK